MLVSEGSLISISARREDRDQALESLSGIMASCSGVVRKKLCEALGFATRLDGDQLVVTHDGCKIGAGSLSLNGRSYTIDVFPKSDGITFSQLQAYFGRGLNETYGQTHALGEQNAQSNADQYSFTYLFGLLAEIAKFGAQILNIYSTRRRMLLRGSPRGRIIPQSFVRSQLMGQYDSFECEVLDNERLRLYATVFYHTAMSIVKDLEIWSRTQALSGFDVKRMRRGISAQLRPYIVDGFSRQMLVRLSLPPFPFGVKELFGKCLRYWNSRGQLSSSECGGRMAFMGFSVRLDFLFEDYVGLVFEKYLGSSVYKVKKRSYEYGAELGGVRYLEPDHVFVDREKKRLYIVEVKYSNDIAAREHVAQLICYIDYELPKWRGLNKVGLVVYPGSTPECTQVKLFSKEIYILRVTSSLDESILELTKSLGRVDVSAGI